MELASTSLCNKSKVRRRHPGDYQAEQLCLYARHLGMPGVCEPGLKHLLY
jgi:hypothetical protein